MGVRSFILTILVSYAVVLGKASCMSHAWIVEEGLTNFVDVTPGLIWWVPTDFAHIWPHLWKKNNWTYCALVSGRTTTTSWEFRWNGRRKVQMQCISQRGQWWTGPPLDNSHHKSAHALWFAGLQNSVYHLLSSKVVIKGWVIQEIWLSPTHNIQV